MKNYLVQKSFNALDVILGEKFIAAVASLLVVFNVLPATAEAEVVKAVLTVVAAVGYIIGVAVENKRG